MTLRKYAHGNVLEEDAGSVDSPDHKVAKTAWTPQDQAELKEENQK
jgi:hypothetical protein